VVVSGCFGLGMRRLGLCGGLGSVGEGRRAENNLESIGEFRTNLRRTTGLRWERVQITAEILPV
jgi:hypothetical protein